VDNSLLGLIGLARRAGKLELGEESAIAATLAHKARLVLLAADAADNAARQVRRAAEQGNAPCMVLPFSKAELGGAVGRSLCAAAAFTDVGLAAAAAKKLAGETEEYRDTAQRLDKKAEKTLRRRREKERRLRKAGEGKPWAPPPKGKNPS